MLDLYYFSIILALFSQHKYLSLNEPLKKKDFFIKLYKDISIEIRLLNVQKRSLHLGIETIESG